MCMCVCVCVRERERERERERWREGGKEKGKGREEGSQHSFVYKWTSLPFEQQCSKQKTPDLLLGGLGSSSASATRCQWPYQILPLLCNCSVMKSLNIMMFEHVTF